MKKILIMLFLVYCIGPAFAQKGAGKAAQSLTGLERQVARAAQKTVRTALAAEYVPITNLPGSPTVKFRLPFVAGVEKSTAALLAPDDVYPLVFSKGPRATYPKKMFVPQGFLSKNKNFYRGMKLVSLEDLTNLFKNGLELGKSVDFPDKIYATSEASFAVAYAMPSTAYNSFWEVEANLPVLIKIPATEELRQYAPEVFRYHETFRRDVPAQFISDIWVFLEVNGKPDWYKVVWQNGELVFTPAPGKMRSWSAGVEKKNK
ncbi:MAG: hypothetical protein IKP06_04100 [Elusimicrobiaceae bacterium]|nr:hypothetical protein [Elusimicrobiaceae bacterium]